jgi:hypothetical protein
MKEKLIAYLIVKSVNNKNIPVDIAQWALELNCNPMDLRLLLNHLQIKGEIRQWEEDGVQYVNMFG